MGESQLNLGLDKEKRLQAWIFLSEALESYLEQIGAHQVTPNTDISVIHDILRSYTFEAPKPPLETIGQAFRGLVHHQMQVAHPSYFGLFNPAPTSMGIIADTLVATFNPQLATWSHSPFAVEVEKHLIKQLGLQFGYLEGKIDGTFTSGGAEANHTALLTALNSKFPEFLSKGAVALEKQPVFYISSESHHSFLKAARISGLGNQSIRAIPVTDELKMNIGLLKEQIQQDREAGLAPFMVVATAGTTNAGVIDPISAIAEIAKSEGLWFHLDGAWGGAGVLLPEWSHLFKGSERADSITIDAHKWFSVPMGAGIFLTCHPKVLGETFATKTDYMPDEHSVNIDPYSHSIQWSRRFIGLKLFLSLAVAGWDGYRETFRHQIELGELLRERLEQNGWSLLNETELPVVCFGDESDRSEAFLKSIEKEIHESGKAWLSTTRLGGEGFALRACITNYKTQADHIHQLVKLLNETRDRVMKFS